MRHNVEAGPGIPGREWPEEAQPTGTAVTTTLLR